MSLGELERRPFIFGVAYILDEPALHGLLHMQFESDEQMTAYIRSLGYEIDFDKASVMVDSGTGVVTETVVLDRNGGVGAVDLIDEGDKPKVAGLIEETVRNEAKQTRWFIDSK